MKKILICLLGLVGVSGCTDIDEQSEAYLKGKQEIAYIVEKEAFTCENEEFFYIEKENGNRLNFIYNNYSTPLSQKPSIETILFSDGVYKLSIKNNIAKVLLENEIILTNCKKTI